MARLNIVSIPFKVGSPFVQRGISNIHVSSAYHGYASDIQATIGRVQTAWQGAGLPQVRLCLAPFDHTSALLKGSAIDPKDYLRENIGNGIAYVALMRSENGKPPTVFFSLNAKPGMLNQIFSRLMPNNVDKALVLAPNRGVGA